MAALDQSLGQRLDWHIRQGLRQLGWQGMAAVLMLVAAATLGAVDRLALQPRLTTMQNQPVTVASSAETAAKLPDMNQTAALPGWLQKTAGEAGLTLNQAQYDLEADGATLRYRAVLPLVGNYPALRSFLASTLNQYPNAALETLQLKRESALDEVLQIRLVLAFHLENRK